MARKSIARKGTSITARKGTLRAKTRKDLYTAFVGAENALYERVATGNRSGARADASFELRANKRLEVRASASTVALIKRAADLSNTTTSAFLIAAVTDKAQAVVERDATLRLSVAAQTRFAEALAAPAHINKALSAAFARRRELIEGAYDTAPRSKRRDKTVRVG